MSRWTGLCLLLLLTSADMAYGINALPASTCFYLPATGSDSAQPYIELYWQVDPKSITFKRDTAGIWRGKIMTEIEISCDTGIISKEKYYLQTTPATSLKVAQLQNIMDMHRYMVPPGVVHIRIFLGDAGNKQDTYEYKDSITITPPRETYYSQLQLIDTSYKTELKDNMFLKNGNLQVPLCINFLDDYRSILNYYVELMGTDKIPADQLPITQTVTVTKKEYDYAVAQLTQTDTLVPAANISPFLGRF